MERGKTCFRGGKGKLANFDLKDVRWPCYGRLNILFANRLRQFLNEGLLDSLH